VQTTSYKQCLLDIKKEEAHLAMLSGDCDLYFI